MLFYSSKKTKTKKINKRFLIYYLLNYFIINQGKYWIAIEKFKQSISIDSIEEQKNLLPIYNISMIYGYLGKFEAECKMLQYLYKVILKKNNIYIYKSNFF